MGIRADEQSLVNSCLDWFDKATDCVVWRCNSGKIQTIRRTWVTLGKEGMPDIMGFTSEGLIIGVEAKTTNRKPTPAQAKWLAKIAEVGGFSCVARSLEELWQAWEEWQKAKAIQ